MFFDENTDEQLVKARAKLEQKKNNVACLEREISKLNKEQFYT